MKLKKENNDNDNDDDNDDDKVLTLRASPVVDLANGDRGRQIARYLDKIWISLISGKLDIWYLISEFKIPDSEISEQENIARYMETNKLLLKVHDSGSH